MKLFLIISLFFCHREVNSSYSHRPMDLMADLTNDLGVCILQMQTSMQHGNIAFSPYGVASMTVLLFEGATGNTALEIMRIMNLPWNILLTRIGFRDINRHLKTYFKSDGFLRGLIMSRDDVCFHQSYQKLLRIYGFEEPEKALTYPCTGFLPYSPMETTFTSSTMESVSSVSPSSANETVTLTSTSTSTTSSTTMPTTTVIAQETDENVVTELTQTSQTVLVFNSTTFKTVNADTVNGAQIYSTTNTPLLKNTENFDRNSPTTELNNKLSTNSLNVNAYTDTSPLHITAASSDVVMNTTVNGKITTNGFVSSSTMETAESTLNQQKFTKASVQRNTEAKTRTNTTSTTKSTLQKPLLNSVSTKKPSYSSSNFPGINSTKSVPVNEEKMPFNRTTNENTVSKQNSPENVFNELNLSEKDFQFLGNDSYNFNDNLNKKNFTLKLRPNFQFPSVNTESIDKFFDNQTDEIFGITDEISFGHNSNLSIIDNWNGTNLPTSNTPFLSTTENNELNFNKSTAFYNTLFNFIENTTKKIKDFVNFDESITTSTVPPKKIGYNASVDLTARSKNSTNSTADFNKNSFKNIVKMTPTVGNKTKLTNSSSISILSNNEKSNINLNKNNSTDLSDVRNLPKKSISANNEKRNAAAVSLVSGGEIKEQLSSSHKPNNYLNIVSLKRSKLISSNYDIKGVNSAKHLFKRSIPLQFLKNYSKLNTKESTFQKYKLSNDSQNNLTNHLTEKVQYIPTKLTIGKNIVTDKKTASFYKDYSFPRTIADQNYLSPFLVPADDYGSDYRKIRSYDHTYFQPFEMGWFSISNQNIVRTPTFTYSAILPFAYIEELKAKIMEIPLDDENYSLLLLLPTSESGLKRLLDSLRNWPIRKFYDYLRGTAVFATIPKFNIISHVNLKPVLYALGIRDVFHRYRADLSVMSPDARLFVKSIEQVVTIRVDKFRNKAYPVPEIYTEQYFIASHPFVYFVIDKETSVSLVAGIMADPTRQSTRFV